MTDSNSALFASSLHDQHFIYAFLKKMSNIYLNTKTMKNKIQKSFQFFFSKTKYFIYVQSFLNTMFSRKFSVTVDMA